MNKFKKLYYLFFTSLLLLPFAVQSITFDFTDGTTFSGADGNNTFSTTVSGVEITLDAGGSGEFLDTITQDNTNGIGINDVDDTESPADNDFIQYEHNERMEITFDTLMNITQITIEQIVETPTGEEPEGEEPTPAWRERGRYSTDGSNWTIFEKSGGGTTLVLPVSLETDTLFIQARTQSLINTALTPSQESDLTIAEIQGAPVPEPATYSLLGMSLVVASALRYRKRRVKCS